MRVSIPTYIVDHALGDPFELIGEPMGQALAAALIPLVETQARHENLVLDFAGIEDMDEAFIRASFVSLAYRMQLQGAWPNCYWVFENLAEHLTGRLEKVLKAEAKARKLRNFTIPVQQGRTIIPVGKMEKSLMTLWKSFSVYPYGFGPRDIQQQHGQDKYWVSVQMKKLRDLRLVRYRKGKASWGTSYVYRAITRPCFPEFVTSGVPEEPVIRDDAERLGLHTGPFWVPDSARAG